ncbi:hypothetical protein DPMN_092517 [Dreissena polymorpha]|uniref:Uncharacterized protein n=1 Tax=Dreissena polymorpha TaxID=45954 RepID=A0A9D4R046_DREPO|nr:hypothetical protein DPMN_092517 [Dreissena polymorpha]
MESLRTGELEDPILRGSPSQATGGHPFRFVKRSSEAHNTTASAIKSRRKRPGCVRSPVPVLWTCNTRLVLRQDAACPSE